MILTQRIGQYRRARGVSFALRGEGRPEEKNYVCFTNREGGATEESFSFYKGKLQSLGRRGMTVYTSSQGWWYEPGRAAPESGQAIF